MARSRKKFRDVLLEELFVLALKELGKPDSPFGRVLRRKILAAVALLFLAITAIIATGALTFLTM